MAEHIDDTTGAVRWLPRYCEARASLAAFSCTDQLGQARYDVVTTSSSGREMLRHPACELHGNAEVNRARQAGQIATTELRGPFTLRPWKQEPEPKPDAARERVVTITFTVDPCDLTDDEVHALVERQVSRMDPGEDPNVLTYDHTTVLTLPAR